MLPQDSTAITTTSGVGYSRCSHGCSLMPARNPPRGCAFDTPPSNPTRSRESVRPSGEGGATVARDRPRGHLLPAAHTRRALTPLKRGSRPASRGAESKDNEHAQNHKPPRWVMLFPIPAAAISCAPVQPTRSPCYSHVSAPFRSDRPFLPSAIQRAAVLFDIPHVLAASRTVRPLIESGATVSRGRPSFLPCALAR